MRWLRGLALLVAADVIFIITDDQDVELGSLSSMPILQRELVQQGTTLANFFVDVPVCCP